MTEKVVFRLAPRYFTKHYSSNGMRRETCIKILLACFGMPFGTGSWASLMTQHSEGFQIVCRPDQFARFIVLRYQADECINGVKDLSPRIVDAEEEFFYDKVADQFKGRVARECVYDILSAADVDNRYVSFMEDECDFWVDVSQQLLAARGGQDKEAI